MNHEIKRATGLLVLEAVNSNPNGDPDRDGEPRQRDNGRGEISPVSFKRKLRDLIEQNDKDEHDTPFFKALPEKFSGKEHEKHLLSICSGIVVPSCCGASSVICSTARPRRTAPRTRSLP